MNKKKKNNSEENIAKVEEAMRSSRGEEVYRRYQAVYMMLTTEMNQTEIGRIVGYSRGWVSKIGKRYEREGLESLVDKEQVGTRYRAMLSLEEEAEFVDSFREKGGAGGILTVKEIHEALKEKVGRDMHVTAVYKMLARHGWRKITPRPRHPNRSLEAMETFKKSGRKL